MTGLRHLFAWRPGNLAKGTLAMTTGMGLRMLGQVGVFFIVTRVLGVEAYGAYSAVLALAMTFGGFVGLGVSMIMLRDTARDPRLFSDSWGRTLAALLVTAPLVLIIYLLLAWVILPNEIPRGVIACIGVAEIVFAPLVLAAVQAYQGLERIGRAARLVLVQVLPRLAAALMLPFMLLSPLLGPLDIWGVAYLLAAAASAGYALWQLQRDFDLVVWFQWHGLARAIRDGWPFSVVGVTQKVYLDIDKIMLARFASLQSVGAYSAAYRLVDIADVPLTSFFAAAAPRFFQAGSGGVRSAVRYALHVLPLPLVYALVMTTALYAFAPVLPVLLGADYAPAVEVLRWLAWLPLLVTPRRFLQTALGASGRQRESVIVLTFGAVLNVAFNLWLIPLWGLYGAVVATYAAELAMSAFMLTLIVRTVFIKRGGAH